jgi:hypothetical protein
MTGVFRQELRRALADPVLAEAGRYAHERVQ